MIQFRNTVRLIVIACPIALLIGCSTQESVADDGSPKKTVQSKAETSLKGQAAIDSSASLSEQLSARAGQSAAKAPEELRRSFAAGINMVRDSGIENSAKQVGDAAVDGELIGWDGETVQLSKLWHDGPIVLMWYRGGWCPYCNIQLRAMQQELEAINDAGARLVVLTPELPEKAKETAENSSLDIVALHDRDNQLASKYGIVFDLPEPIVAIHRDKIKLPSYNGNDKMQLPLAATYVIDSSGKITYAFLDADYKKRAEPSDVLEAVKAASKKQ